MPHLRLIENLKGYDIGGKLMIWLKSSEWLISEGSVKIEVQSQRSEVTI